MFIVKEQEEFEEELEGRKYLCEKKDFVSAKKDMWGRGAEEKKEGDPG